jgi:hypothetical protein
MYEDEHCCDYSYGQDNDFGAQTAYHKSRTSTVLIHIHHSSHLPDAVCCKALGKIRVRIRSSWSRKGGTLEGKDSHARENQSMGGWQPESDRAKILD